MKKKNIKPVVLSALSALALGAVGTVGTFALFTDKAETTIEIGSGIVDISLSASGLHTYSAEASSSGDRIDENGAKYISKATAVEGVFTNGGTAALENNTLTLQRVTPGDRVVFNAQIGNGSNVDIKYRLKYQLVGEDNDLAPALVTKADISGVNKEYQGLEKFVSPWYYLAASTAPDKTDFAFDIEMPIDEGDEYQDKSASFKLIVEAVQGNAAVLDEQCIESVDKIAKTVVVEDNVNDTVVVGQNTTGSVKVTTTIPAAAEQIQQDDTVTIVVGEIETDAGEEFTDLSFDLSLLVNGEKVEEFSEYIDVEVYVGENLGITKLTHNSVEVTVFDYNPTTGIVKFQTKNFSPFVVTYHNPDTSKGYHDSFEVDGHWVHVLDSVAHFEKMLADMGAALNGTSVQLEAAKQTVYRLNRDLDLTGVEAGAFNAMTFVGTLEGNGHKIENYSFDDDTAVGVGLIGRFYQDSVVRNLTLDHVNVVGKENVGILFGMSYNHANKLDTPAYYNGTSLTFENVTIGEHCSVRGEKGCGGVAGSTRYTATVNATNVINKASVSSSSYNVGGLFGTMTAVSTLNADHCENYGFIRGTTQVGGLCGHCDSLENINLSNCKNYGNITAFGSITKKINGVNVTFTNVGMFCSQHASSYTLNYVNNYNEGKFYYTSENASYLTMFEEAKIGDGIALPAGKTIADYKVEDDTVILNVTLEDDNSFTVSEVNGAVSYTVMMQVYSREVTLSGNTATVVKEKGFVKNAKYTNVSDLKANFGYVTRLGYVLDSVYTEYDYIPGVYGVSANATANGRANFFRLPYADRNNYQLGKVAQYSSINNEWALIIDAEAEGTVEGTGIIFSPKDTYVHYLFEAYDANDHLLAFKEIKNNPAEWACAVTNMAGQGFDGSQAAKDTVYPLVA